MSIPEPTRQVALLRGINVGKAKRIAMADLRAVFEGLGYSEVRTLLNSGNVVFSGPAAGGAALEEAIVVATGVRSKITVLTADEVAAAVDENPLTVAHPSRFMVVVLANPAGGAKVRHLLDQDWGNEGIAVGTRVVYLNCPDGILTSRVLDAAGRLLGTTVTMRNWATMLKLRDMTQTGRETG